MGGLSIGASFLPLTVVIDMPTTARILIQFVGQIVDLRLLRRRRDPGPYDHDGLESFGARLARHGPSQALGPQIRSIPTPDRAKKTGSRRWAVSP